VCPSHRGQTSPDSPAATLHQLLHGPVRGRLRGLAYLCDSLCASHCLLVTARHQELTVPTRAALAIVMELSTHAGKRGRNSRRTAAVRGTSVAYLVREQMAGRRETAQHHEAMRVWPTTHLVSPPQCHGSFCNTTVWSSERFPAKRLCHQFQHLSHTSLLRKTIFLREALDMALPYHGHRLIALDGRRAVGRKLNRRPG
jgi:hypothetical protein